MVISSHYAEYMDVQKQRAELRRRTPLLKDKGEWLGYILTSTSKNHGLTFEALSQQEERDAGPLILVSRGANVTGTYEQVGAWLAEMENSKIFLKITTLEMSKSPSDPTSVQVKIILSIVFPNDSSQGEGTV
jgi:Tfp pilus assembly protein PilO